MDDLAICLQSQTGEEVVQKVGMVASRLLELCIEHGMTPNLSKNKTEVLLSFRGHGSRKQKKVFSVRMHRAVCQLLQSMV
jgi:hypothetical protein